MKRAGAVAAVLALFLLGVAAGVLATHLFYARQLRDPGGPPFLASRFFGELLARRLDLTPEQEQEIQVILRRTRWEAAQLRRDLRPQVRDLMDEATREIEQVLTPEQREAFARMRERQRRRSEQFLLGPPGPHPDPGRRPLNRRRPLSQP
ncbi:MAG: hypothetical protein V3R89_06870 [Thermoanaerobaculia bacterium]